MIDEYAQKEKDAKYTEIIAQADEQFNKEQYGQAKAIYTRAVAEFPEKTYAKQKLAEIRQIESDNNLAEKQSQYDKLAADAESAVASEKYSEAKQLYQQASQVMPNNPYPAQRINEINAIIDKIARSKDEEIYNELIVKADGLFENTQYESAKAFYNQAKLKMPENTYPQQKINEINNIEAKAAAAEKEKEEVQNKYDNIIKLANKYFNEESYSLAKSEYEKALTIFENEAYPLVQLKKIESLIAEQQRIIEEKQALENQIKLAISQADRFFKEKKYGDSKSYYSKVVELAPGHIHATAQIKRIDEIIALQAKQIQEQREVEEKYKVIITNADTKFKQKDYKWSRQLYLAALEVKPNEPYPRNQIKSIDNSLRNISASQSTSNANSATNSSKIQSSGSKMEDLSSQSESKRKQYLNSLKNEYPPGITLEIYKEGGKTTKRYIVHRDGEVHEFREISFSWGGKSYTFDGKPTNSFHVQKNIKPRDGEKYQERKM
jgi:tetratricopeptide (TPR) repeat protein